MVTIDDQGPDDGRGGDDDFIDRVKDTLADGLEFTTSAGSSSGPYGPAPAPSTRTAS